jgi:hypothetical protein
MKAAACVVAAVATEQPDLAWHLGDHASSASD